jgi:hypothetical protein
MKRSINLLIAALAVVATAGCVNEDGDAQAVESKNMQVVKAAGEYWAAHPDDYAGLARAIESAGGDTVRFSFNMPGLQSLTGEQAQSAYSAFASEGSEPEHAALAGDVPVNAFEVGASWYHVQDQYGEWWNFDGTWNYRDDYIGSGSPDNASGVVVEGMDEKCWRQDGDWMHAAAYDGENHTDLTYRKEVDAKSSVWGVRDRTSGFKLLTDHGTHTISFKRVGDGCDEKPSGKFYWEHNQDGGSGGWSFSINLAIFSISYADNSAGMTLQKSSGLTHRP